MGSKLSALRGLAPGERWVLLVAWVQLLLTEARLRLLPWRATAAGLTRQEPVTRCAPDAAATARRVQRLVKAAADHHLLPVRCLARSLVLRRLLRRRGVAAELRIGVERWDGALRAHAWLEHAGEPLGEPADLAARFLPLVRPEASP